ncbi:TPA: helix-turn-helix transcriptional regulator [Citrobacter gillenii]
MNISIKCHDNLYKFGLIALLCEVFSSEMEQRKLSFLDYNSQNILVADIVILTLGPGECYICHPEFYTRSPGLIVGLVDRGHMPARGELPSCINHIIFIPHDAGVNQMGEMIKHNWLLRKNEKIINAERSCLRCPRKTFTEKQSQIICLSLLGFTSKQIGVQLDIGQKTVLAHRKGLMDKYRLKSDCQLLQLLAAVQEKWLDKSGVKNNFLGR